MQWGDEGKGKIVASIMRSLSSYLHESLTPSVLHGDLRGDFRGGGHDGLPVLNERFNGGANAGHTVVIGDQRYALHQVPSGVLYPLVYGFLNSGVFFNPVRAVAELDALAQQGVALGPHNLGISSTAHITLAYHILDDARNKDGVNGKKHTTTGQGIKQTAIDKYGRMGVRFVEFLDEKLFAQILTERKFPDGIPDRYHDVFTSVDELVESYAPVRERLAPFLALDTHVKKKHGNFFTLYEGANGFMLDVGEGQYPGTTSSHIAAVPGRPETIIGIFKAYASSVGGGDRAFVAEMETDLADAVRDVWHERGTTTGKPRDLGYFDCVAAQYALDTVRPDVLALTCLDRLEELGRREKPVRVVIEYEIDGQRYDAWDVTFNKRNVLAQAKPIHAELPSWTRTVEGGRLSGNAQRYVDFIQNRLGKEFALIGIGREDTAVLEYRPLLE